MMLENKSQMHRIKVMKARDYGLYLINRRAYTKKELENKLLKKGFQQEEVTEILNEFIKLKWINDYVYAEIYVLNQIKYGFKSKIQIQHKLIEKGIDKDIIIAFIKQYYTREKEEKIIKYLIEKYSRKRSLSRKKLIFRLGRKGFSIVLVISILSEELYEEKII